MCDQGAPSSDHRARPVMPAVHQHDADEAGCLQPTAAGFCAGERPEDEAAYRPLLVSPASVIQSRSDWLTEVNADDDHLSQHVTLRPHRFETRWLVFGKLL